MSQRKFPIFMYVLIGIAAVGLFSWLIRNPQNFLITIFTTVIIAFVIFLIAKALLNRGMTPRGSGGGDEMKKYRQAVRQSKKKYNQIHPKKQTLTMANDKRVKRRRRVPHLTVIEGKKSIKKNNDDQASN